MAQMHDTKTMISLFSGAGGLDIGLEQAGFTTVLANELEPHVCETLRSNRVLRSLKPSKFPNWFESHVLSQRCYRNSTESQQIALRDRLLIALGETVVPFKNAKIVQEDIRKLRAEDIFEYTGLNRGELDLMAGGPPCQPFSRAGKREMTASQDGRLFLEYVRLVDAVRPRWVLFENVKGLVIHKADMCRISCIACGLKTLPPFQERDHFDNKEITDFCCPACNSRTSHTISWTKERSGALDMVASEFQRLGYKTHTRVLNAANYGAPQNRERLFLVASRDNECFEWPQETHFDPKRLSSQANLFDVPGDEQRPYISLQDALYDKGHWQFGKLNPNTAVLWVKNVVRPHDEPVTWTLDRVAPTIGAHQAAKLAIAPFGVPEAQLSRQQWHVLGRRQGDSPPVFVEHEYLQDEELLAIQTFPRSWYIHGTRMQRAFQIGNAVPPILSRRVGEQILSENNLSTSFLEKPSHEHDTSSLHA